MQLQFVSNMKIGLSFFALYFVLLNAAFNQAELGNGLIKLNLKGKTKIELFSSTNDNIFSKKIEIDFDTIAKAYNLKKPKAGEGWLKPEVLWLGNISVVFRCKSKKDKWFEIVVNNETGKTFWIKNNNVKFLEWYTFLEEMFLIRRKSSYPQKIRKQPFDTSVEIDYMGEDCFKMKRMSGDWIEIYSPAYCFVGYKKSKVEIRSAWIKWKSGNILLIDYFLTQ